MARGDRENQVTVPLLDRLTDRDPRSQQEAMLTRAQSVRLLKESVRRDLEWLLNSRRIKEESTDPKAELTHSLYNYGLTDLTSYAVHSTRDQNRLSWMLENTVAIFEPRLAAAKVFMVPVETGSMQIRFRVEGMLKMDPAPERVSFDTTLDLSSQTYNVEGG
ncbi:MAG: type VI secretion system baseplate subunit TssE [Acidobacteria bacterium]|nr:type VI secretion system baseplate subunit TssE [Acidobacteriota bacterium]